MAILSTAEQADMLKRMANRVIDDNRSQPLYPSYARAILNVVAALEDAQAQLDAVRESRDDMEDKYFGSMIDDERDPYP